MPKPTATKDPLDRLRSRKKAAFKRVPIRTDSDVIDRVERRRRKLNELNARAQLAKAPSAELAGELAAAEDDLDEALVELEACTEWFMVKALAPEAYDKLSDQHPPSKDQRQKARRNNMQLTWNPDTFPPALIAACAHLITYGDEPAEGEEREETHTPLDDEFVEDMYSGGQWNSGEIMALFQACLEVNSSYRTGGTTESLGNG